MNFQFHLTFWRYLSLLRLVGFIFFGPSLYIITTKILYQIIWYGYFEFQMFWFRFRGYWCKKQTPRHAKNDPTNFGEDHVRNTTRIACIIGSGNLIQHFQAKSGIFQKHKNKKNNKKTPKTKQTNKNKNKKKKNKRKMRNSGLHYCPIRPGMKPPSTSKILHFLSYTLLNVRQRKCHCPPKNAYTCWYIGYFKIQFLAVVKLFNFF